MRAERCPSLLAPRSLLGIPPAERCSPCLAPLEARQGPPSWLQGESRSLGFISTTRTPSSRLARQSIGTENVLPWVDWARDVQSSGCAWTRPAGVGSSKIGLDGMDQYAERVDGHARRDNTREEMLLGMLTAPYTCFWTYRPSRALSSTASVSAAVTASAPSPRVSPTPSFPLSRRFRVYTAAGQEASWWKKCRGGTDPLLPVTLPPAALDTLVGLMALALKRCYVR